MEYLEHTVIVLPGILGSELVDDRGRKIWGELDYRPLARRVAMAETVA
ncbi:hypothetical protein SKPI104516_02150 [Skermania piniformis]